jgi:hypothetical protein
MEGCDLERRACCSNDRSILRLTYVEGPTPKDRIIPRKLDQILRLGLTPLNHQTRIAPHIPQSSCRTYVARAIKARQITPTIVLGFCAGLEHPAPIPADC